MQGASREREQTVSGSGSGGGSPYTYAFGRTYVFGSQPWQQTCLPDGKVKVTRNPSISEQVSCYMVSLCRRKVSNTPFQVVYFTLTFA